MNITPTPWQLFPPGSVIGHSDKAVIKRKEDFDWVASVQVSNTPEWEENAKAIVSAVNGTWGVGFNPEHLKDLLALINEAPELISRAVEILDAYAERNNNQSFFTPKLRRFNDKLGNLLTKAKL